MTSRHKWEYNIKINHGETECKYVCWIKGLLCSTAISREHGVEIFHFCARWEFNDRQVTARF